MNRPVFYTRGIGLIWTFALVWPKTSSLLAWIMIINDCEISLDIMWFYDLVYVIVIDHRTSCLYSGAVPCDCRWCEPWYVSFTQSVCPSMFLLPAMYISIYFFYRQSVSQYVSFLSSVYPGGLVIIIWHVHYLRLGCNFLIMDFPCMCYSFVISAIIS